MSPQLKKEFRKITKKYLNGTATSAEIQIIEQYYDLFGDEPEVTDQLTEPEIEILKNRLKEGIDNKNSAFL